MAPNDDEPKVKDLLAGRSLSAAVDAATARELEKWFGLPSFEQLAEQPVAPDDPDMLAARERRDKAIAEVDPKLLASIRHRTEDNPESLLKFAMMIDVRLDPDMPLFDYAMAESHHKIAEPRERERPTDLEDELKECTPQALLRDLHRAETDFEKTFELVDNAAAQRYDIVAEVAAAMAMSFRLPALDRLPRHDAAALWDEARAERRKPWPALFASMPLANRTVQE
ncbi:MAG: hypothetical protein JWO36_7027 [Myxococcales bacterium]|nr:hypothetical protein [Myxococcales bacterium]